jgi:hypothetical protein
MFDSLPNVLMILFEVFCCKIFYEIFGKVRYKGWINAVQLILLIGSVYGVARGLENIFVLKQIVIIILFAAFMFWHMKISIKKSLILAVLYQGLLLIVDYIAFLIYSSGLFSNGESTGLQYMLENVLVVLLGKVLLYFSVLIIKKKFGEKSTEMLADSEWLKFLFFPIFTIAIIVAMFSGFGYTETTEQIYFLFIIAFGMAGMNILEFYLINDIIEREIKLHENEIFQIQVKNQTEMYRSISENFDGQKRKTHEYKNQIVCIESLLGNRKYQELEKYVKEIYGHLDKELDAINTNNVIVNAILNTKYQEADAKGIVFVFRVNDLSQIRIKDEDVVTILSNLLNNAIEACEKCDDKKVIKLKFVNEDEMIIIAVKNTFSHPICYENGEIKSSKISRAEEHGIGIKNIIKTIEKYNGSYIIEDNKNEFYFSIIIPA